MMRKLKKNLTVIVISLFLNFEKHKYIKSLNSTFKLLHFHEFLCNKGIGGGKRSFLFFYLI